MCIRDRRSPAEKKKVIFCACKVFLKPSMDNKENMAASITRLLKEGPYAVDFPKEEKKERGILTFSPSPQGVSRRMSLRVLLSFDLESELSTCRIDIVPFFSTQSRLHTQLKEPLKKGFLSGHIRPFPP